MRISLSSLIKILHAEFPTDYISINPLQKADRGHVVFVEIEWGLNQGHLVYDLAIDEAYGFTQNFEYAINSAIRECKLREIEKKITEPTGMHQPFDA